MAQGFLLLGGHGGHEIHHPVVVAISAAMLGKFYKVVTESHASQSLRGGKVSFPVKVTGVRLVLVLSVAQDAL